MVPEAEAGAWTVFVSKTPIGNQIAIDFAYETPTPTPSSPPLMNALHYKAAALSRFPNHRLDLGPGFVAFFIHQGQIAVIQPLGDT